MTQAILHTWTRVDELYRSLEEQGWAHIPAFTKLLPAIRSRAEMMNLVPVTTHERLLLSNYSDYPDFFENKHIVLSPQHDETVIVEVWDAGHEKAETLCYGLSEALTRILTVIDNHFGTGSAATSP